MNTLRITGDAQAGKTHALIAIARAEATSGLGPIAYVSPWPSARVFFREHQLGPAVRFFSIRAAIEGFKGLRPHTVLVDEFDKVSSRDQSALLATLQAIGVRYVVAAECS